MSCYSSILLLSVIAVNCVINRALPQEGIIGGIEIRSDLVAYHVAILGRRNYSNTDNLLCSGAIINSRHVVAAAQCVVENSIKLRDLRFSVAAGVHDLSTDLGVIGEVELIFISMYDGTNSVNDFTVLQLTKSLIRPARRKLQMLRIPAVGENFTEKIATVTGYGYTWVKTQMNFQLGRDVRVDGDTDYKLRVASVKIVSDQLCGFWYINYNPYKHICALMYRNETNQPRGLCTLDAGAPLVFQGKIVGVASRNTPNCDDTIQGCLYSKIQYNHEFINKIVNKRMPANSVVFANKFHIPEPIPV